MSTHQCTPVVVALLLLAPTYARADDGRLRPSLQLDLGLAVVGAGVELPVTAHAAAMIEGHAFSTYFAPWFDRGDRLDGVGGGLRLTWFSRGGGHGLYLTASARIDRVTGDDTDDPDGHAIGYSFGVAAGGAFAITTHLDGRVGFGVQYLHYRLAPLAVTTPFVQLDAVIAYHL